MPNAKIIGERLKTLREKKKYSQQELADIIGIGQPAIAMYENGERIPRDETKLLLAKALGRSVNFIFFND